MIEPPSIARRPAMRVAAVHLDIARTEMPRHFGGALAEIRAALAAQGIAAAGPIVTYHRSVTPDRFDVEVAVPTLTAVAAEGRVGPRDWPAATVAGTIYTGSLDGLHGAWGHFNAWLAAHNHATTGGVFETYLTDPKAEPDPAAYRTRLERVLAA